MAAALEGLGNTGGVIVTGFGSALLPILLLGVDVLEDTGLDAGEISGVPGRESASEPLSSSGSSVAGTGTSTTASLDATMCAEGGSGSNASDAAGSENSVPCSELTELLLELGTESGRIVDVPESL
tara:strand:+ start:543 stop:920 length:378 start_codon:yes stop_codon:yes gene_type:complete